MEKALADDSDDPQDQAPDPSGRGTGMTSVHDQLPAQGTVVHGDATSVVTTRGAVDQDDGSTHMAMRSTSTHGRDWDKQLPLSTDPARTTLRRKSPKKSSILTLRDGKPKPRGCACC